MVVDPYRRLLLNAVSAVLDKPPSSAALFELLKIVAPTLTLGDLVDDDPIERERCFAELLARVHPDEHRGSDVERRRARRLHRLVPVFYEASLAARDCDNPYPQSSAKTSDYGDSDAADNYYASHHDDSFPTPGDPSHRKSRRRNPLMPKYRPSSPESCGSCLCRHLTDLLALCVVCAFFACAGYVCYYVLNNSGGGD